MHEIWRKQFQGQIHDLAEARDLLSQKGRFAFRDGSLKLVYLQLPQSIRVGASIWRECDRILAEDGLLLLHGEAYTSVEDADAALRRETSGLFSFASTTVMRYRSRVVGHDTVPFVVIRRCEAERCVS